MKRFLCVMLSLVLVLGIGGCARGGAGSGASYAPSPTVSSPVTGAPGFADSSESKAAPPVQSVAPSLGGSANTVVPKADDARLVIRDKTLQLRVAKAEDAVAEARRLVVRFGGTVEQVSLATPDGPPVFPPQPLTAEQQTSAQPVPLGGFITLRVPVARFDAFVNAASGIGHVVSESESSQDVTQQHVDLQARLRNLQAEAATLRVMFGRARNVTEMLKVEAELSRVQGEIESMQAQIAYLERQAAMATVTLELLEPTPITQANEDWGFREALHDSLLAFVTTINGLIVFVGGALPLLVLVALAAWVTLLVLRRRSRRRRPLASDASQQ